MRNSAPAIQYKIREPTNIFSGKKDLFLANSKSRITHYKLNFVTFAFSIKKSPHLKKIATAALVALVAFIRYVHELLQVFHNDVVAQVVMEVVDRKV